ncbi:MAG: hypothetical protein U0165_07885 [Polyangiaceae bacterium]
MGIAGATDTFGGLTGVQYGLKNEVPPNPSAQEKGNSFTNDDHYSVIGRDFKLIQNCHAATPVKPSWWRDEVDGAWNETLDGHVVKVDGQFQKCQQQQVDYGEWSGLRMPTTSELFLPDGSAITDRYRGGPNVDVRTTVSVFRTLPATDRLGRHRQHLGLPSRPRSLTHTSR